MRPKFNINVSRKQYAYIKYCQKKIKIIILFMEVEDASLGMMTEAEKAKALCSSVETESSFFLQGNLVIMTNYLGYGTYSPD
jgi:hypothetical protein